MVAKSFGLKKLERYFGKSVEFNVLDVGTGHYSAERFKKVFPRCNLFGVDISKDNCQQKDIKLMTRFFELDLTSLNYDCIADDFFDVIYCSHVIEHLYNGELVIEGLLKKLKKGGIIYLEFPSIRSISFPSMQGTLNFYDDATHCKLYAIHELLNLMVQNKFKILGAGRRKDVSRILLMPVGLVYYLIKYKCIRASLVWDIYGFADYLLAKKK